MKNQISMQPPSMMQQQIALMPKLNADAALATVSSKLNRARA